MNKIATICLWSLGIFSVGMLFFRWGIIPPLFGDAPNADARNEVMLNLSYSYLAGAIFYFFVTWLPYKLRSRKMRPFINAKKKLIKGKMFDCALNTMPTELVLQHRPSNEEIINHLENTSLLNAPTFMSLLMPGADIHTHWRLQRDEIKAVIKDVLEFKEYLSNNELQLLGQIQDCQFFYEINGVFPITDQPKHRKRFALELVNAIALTEQL